MKFFQLIIGTFFYALLALGGQLLASGPGRTVSYYELLGVAKKDATDALIKSAWQEKMKEWHSDKWQKIVGCAQGVIGDLDSSYNAIKNDAQRKKYNSTPAYSKWAKDTAGAAARARFVQTLRALHHQMGNAYNKLLLDWDVDAWTKTIFGGTEKAPDGRDVYTLGILEKLTLASDDCGPIKPNAYDILGVLPSATDGQIKAAYEHLLVVECRADWNRYLASAKESLAAVEEITRHIMTAYAGLKTARLRATYTNNPLLVSLSSRACKLSDKLSTLKKAKPPSLKKSSPVAPPSAPPGPTSTQNPPASSVDNSQGKSSINPPQRRYVGNKTILAAAGITLTGIAVWYYYTQYYQEVTQEIPVTPTLRPLRTAVDHAFEKNGVSVF